MIPSNLKYSTSHEWIKIENGIATVGITEHAQAELGDITYVELPTIGNEVSQEGEAGSVESVKAASDIYSPISGTISEVNTNLEVTPETINQDPYNEGWIFKLTHFSQEEFNCLMTADAYEKFINE